MAAVALTGILVALVYFLSGEPAEETNLLANKLPVRVELREGEQSREVEYYDDLITPRFAVADLTNGHQQVFHYRPDGTLERATTFGAESNGTRSVLRVAIIDSDGQTFREDKQFYESGNLRRLLLLEDPVTTTERNYFDQNGWNLALSRILSRDIDDKTWKVVQEQAYRENGTRSRTFAIADRVETTVLFDENELVIARYVFDKNQDTYTERDFAEDGETIVRSVNQDDDGTRLELNRPDGTISEKREWWGEIGKSGMHVHKFDEKGRRTVSQWWLLLNDVVVLRQIRVFDPDRDFETRTMLFHTEGPGKGKLEFEMIYESPEGNAGPHTFRDYHPDGSLKVEKVYSGGDNLVSERNLKPQDQVFIEPDPYWVEIQEIEYPPYKVEYIPDDE